MKSEELLSVLQIRQDRKKSYDGNGNIEKMRGKFNELIKDAWEVLDEHLE